MRPSWFDRNLVNPKPFLTCFENHCVDKVFFVLIIIFIITSSKMTIKLNQHLS